MFFVYIIQSLKDNCFYTGLTSNLGQRLEAHNSGQVKSTRRRKPFKIVFYEEFASLREARQREKYLKSYKGGYEKLRLIAKFRKI